MAFFRKKAFQFLVEFDIKSFILETNIIIDVVLNNNFIYRMENLNSLIPKFFNEKQNDP